MLLSRNMVILLLLFACNPGLYEHFLVGPLSDKTNGGIIFSNGSMWQSNRRFTLHHLRNLGFGKGAMEDLVAEEVLEFISCIKKKNGQPTE